MRSLRHAFVAALIALTTGMPAYAQQTEDIHSRDYWEQERATAEGGLHRRSLTCDDYEQNVEDAFQAAMVHVIARHQTFSPSGRGMDHANPTNGIGYINSGAAYQIERDMRTAAEVAFRDMRYVKYDGAQTQQCAAIARTAIDRINHLKSLLP